MVTIYYTSMRNNRTHKRDFENLHKARVFYLRLRKIGYYLIDVIADSYSIVEAVIYGK